MDKVFIRGLSFSTIIGVYEREKHIKQTLLMDITLGTDISTAGRTDDLNDALDYAAISGRITGYVETNRFQLIEKVAETCADIILAEFGVVEVELSVYKPGAVANATDVGVTIVRRQQSN